MPLTMEHLTRFAHIECSKVTAQNTGYPKHTHEEYVISANLRGYEHIWFDGRQQQVSAGQVTLYNPMTVQASEFFAEGTAFISVHLDAQTLLSAFSEASSSHALPVLQEGALTDAALFAAITGLYQQLDTHTAEEALLSLISELARLTRSAARPPEPARIEQLIRFMQANLNEPLELDDLCAVANLSRFHLVRSFKAAAQLPPMQYFQQLRLIEARKRLRSGEPSARIAADLGFFDQAHLSNAFRKVMGASPLGYSSMLGVPGKNSR